MTSLFTHEKSRNLCALKSFTSSLSPSKLFLFLENKIPMIIQDVGFMIVQFTEIKKISKNSLNCVWR